ncbi:MAG TPA: 30S ribosomal protein S20 [Candidatus Dojkabacteria bacterium]|jgi:small subunit ribosomal protein S20|uniref:Small ribosomal subunit protein bS20 n=1 Tax=Candidatus Dojkabacteria bacterium TaxID=2099670 RepID=A0A847D131_9BACT|nr:30S ribosomal protein S20 [Candidatus Dojkabacteria bacterium]NLD25140.1 30S ribosomal protein S20 [Candidatus Dojkabacteria bacterium]HNW32742.1 30S ribosomal protein S20 [Candidatus Dojkabacteria bacterium]HOZ44527.1 30S ribosomal protein S20 [Candidatus Dojkabacteria bacterium]HPR91819.1 30S ribosomal protein S20 [Candidatus Dojkabacteria bacterium]
MPNLKTSIKDLRKSKRRETINDRLRNRVKRVTKKHSDLLKQGNTEEMKKNLVNVYKVLDKAAKKNVIKKGKADRLKSRLTKNLNKLAQDNVKTSKKDS